MTADVTPEMLAANPLDDVVLDKRLAVRLFAALHPSVSDASRGALRSQLAPVLMHQSAHLAALPATPAAQAQDALPPLSETWRALDGCKAMCERIIEQYGGWPQCGVDFNALLTSVNRGLAALATRGQAGESAEVAPPSEQVLGARIRAALKGQPEGGAA
jgi:hypothetical protein